MPYLEAEGRRYPLHSGMNFLGRDPLCNIFVPDPHISRKHASIDLVSDGSMTLIDLGSTNGLTVNGKRAPSAILRPGDTFTVGQTIFRVLKDREPSHAPAGDRAEAGEPEPADAPTAKEAAEEKAPPASL